MRRKRMRITEEELNITAFLNLMVVLIPFLLLNAVFAQVSVLQLNLPANDAQPPSEENKPTLALEVIIRGDRYVVADRNSGPLKTLAATETGHDAAGLRAFLVDVKKKFPDVTSVTLLAEDDIPYELLVQTMDAVRYYQVLVNGQQVKRSLFPDIGIGAAPRAAETGGAA